MDEAVTCYDLHSHSTASDGTLSPTALVDRAYRQGVDVLALTDHDVLDGLAEAERAARIRGVQLIPGVEISVSWGGRVIHIVGLGIDPTQPTLLAGLDDLRRQRQQRAERIGERLSRIGIAGAYAGASELAGGQVVTRSHFAHYLVNEGIVGDFQAAFRRYLRQGRPAHVACDWTSLEQALDWIGDAGGQAVIAHPARYGLSGLKMRALIEEFRAAGGVALEVVSSSHNPVEIRKMADLARRYGLRASVGSDFHSPDQGWVELGRVAPLPSGCTPIWHDWERRWAKKSEHSSVASV